MQLSTIPANRESVTGFTQYVALPAANDGMETQPMHHGRPHPRQARSRGFTAVELAIVIALVAILAGIVLPGMGGIVMRSALTTAQQDLLQALRKAKIVARNENTSVTVTLVANSPRISLLAANGRFNQNIDLPATVAPAQSASYRFNPMGVLNQVGTITLVSLQDPAQTRQVVIQTLFGQVEAG